MFSKVVTALSIPTMLSSETFKLFLIILEALPNRQCVTIAPRKIIFTSLRFSLFTQQFKIQMQRVQYATYNRLGVCSKA